jgi:hypothetical protein
VPGLLAAEEHGDLRSTDLPLLKLLYNEKLRILWHYANVNFQTRLSKIDGL